MNFVSIYFVSFRILQVPLWFVIITIKTLKSSFSLGKMSNYKLKEGQPPSYQATAETPQPQEAPPKYEPTPYPPQGKLGI